MESDPIDYFYSKIEDNDIDEVIKILSTGFSPDTVNIYGETPLLKAAEYGADAIIQALIRFGSQALEIPGPDGRTPVLEAAWFGNPSTVELLISLGANVSARTLFTQGSIYHATVGGPAIPDDWVDRRIEIVQFLIRLVVPGIESTDIYGATPLHSAVDSAKNDPEGSVRLIRLLLKVISGSNAELSIDHLDNQGKTVLDLAGIELIQFADQITISDHPDEVVSTLNANPEIIALIEIIDMLRAVNGRWNFLANAVDGNGEIDANRVTEILITQNLEEELSETGIRVRDYILELLGRPLDQDQIADIRYQIYFAESQSMFSQLFGFLN